MKDKINVFIAVLIVTSYCGLVYIGKIDAATFPPIAMYVIKKFMDNINGGSK